MEKRALGVILITVLVYLCIVAMFKSVHCVENFKRKKKGKRGRKCQKVKRKKIGKKGKEEEEEVNECEPEIEIDFDEILDKVDEAQEEDNEPADNELDPDPEDEEGYISPVGDNEGLGGDDAGDDDPRDIDRVPSLSTVLAKFQPLQLSKKDEAAQYALIEKQPNSIVNDLLYFALIENAHTKRVICVLPSKFKKLYILQLEENVGTRGLIISGSHLTVVVPDVVESDIITKIDIYDGQTHFDSALTEYRYVLFFDDPVNHVFFKWLDNSKYNVSFVDYLAFGKRGIVANKYPFVHIRNTDVKDLLPNKTFKKRNIPTLVVNYLIYSNKPFNNDFYLMYDKYYESAKYQGFFELFFKYYDEIMANRLGLAPSTRLKGITFHVERFQAQPRMQIDVNKMLDSLEVVSHIRSVFKEMKVTYKELKLAAKARIQVMDVIRFKNQKHRSLEGEFYIVFISRRHNVCLLQSRILLKHVYNFKMLNEYKAVCTDIDKYTSSKLKIKDRVFIKSIDKPAVYLGYSNAYYFQVYDDEENIQNTYKCSNPDILTQRACISTHDGLGNVKPTGADIWDRPCYYDEECPFFGKGVFSAFRGGCQESGYCEMPIGYTNASYRYYDETLEGRNMKNDNNGFRFYADIFEIK